VLGEGSGSDQFGKASFLFSDYHIRISVRDPRRDSAAYAAVCRPHSGAGGYGFRILRNLGIMKRLWYARFHSMSAFCNVGLNLQLMSLECDAIPQYIIWEKTACNGAAGEFMRHITTD
jgi:hypothetical protein